MNGKRMSEVIDHVRTSFAFNLENVKVVIHVALLICSKLLSHPIFVSSVQQRTPPPLAENGARFRSKVWPIYGRNIFIISRCRKTYVIDTDVRTVFNHIRTNTLFVHIRHKTGNVNSDHHFYKRFLIPILEYINSRWCWSGCWKMRKSANISFSRFLLFRK